MLLEVVFLFFPLISHEQTEQAATSQMKVNAAAACSKLPASRQPFRSGHDEGAGYWQRWLPAQLKRRL